MLGLGMRNAQQPTSTMAVAREKSKKTQIQNPKLCTFENGLTKTAFKVPYKVSLVGNFSALCVTVVLN